MVLLTWDVPPEICPALAEPGDRVWCERKLDQLFIRFLKLALDLPECSIKLVTNEAKSGNDCNRQQGSNQPVLDSRRSGLVLKETLEHIHMTQLPLVFGASAPCSAAFELNTSKIRFDLLPRSKSRS